MLLILLHLCPTASISECSRITFGSPKQDICEICIEEKEHLKKPHLAGDPACLQCGRYLLHQKGFVICRQFYQMDSSSTILQNGETVVYAMDMQRVLLLPMMTAKSHFFISKLVFVYIYFQLRQDAFLGPARYLPIFSFTVSAKFLGNFGDQINLQKTLAANFSLYLTKKLSK